MMVNRIPNILLVDDDTTLLELMENSFREAGFNVTTAVDGVAATVLTDTKRFDTIVTDIVMPRMGGLQFAGNAKAGLLNNATPIFMISGVTNEESLRKAREIGMINVFPKPFELDQVVAAIRQEVGTLVNPLAIAREMVDLFVDAASEVFVFYLGERPCVKKIVNDQDLLVYRYISAEIGLYGKKDNGFICIGFDQNMLCELGKAIFEGRRQIISEKFAGDLAGEIANQIAGSAINALVKLGIDVDLSLPHVTLGLGHRVVRKNMSAITRVECSLGRSYFTIDIEMTSTPILS